MFPLPVILLDPTKNSLLFGGTNVKNISKCCHGKRKPKEMLVASSGQGLCSAFWNPQENLMR